MENKSIIVVASLAALVYFLVRKAHSYSQMAQQTTFLPKVYSAPKISWSELTIPICIDITNPTAEKANVTVLQGSAIIAGKEAAKIKVPSDGASVTIVPHGISRLKGLSIAIPVNNLQRQSWITSMIS